MSTFWIVARCVLITVFSSSMQIQWCSEMDTDTQQKTTGWLGLKQRLKPCVVLIKVVLISSRLKAFLFAILLLCINLIKLSFPQGTRSLDRPSYDGWSHVITMLRSSQTPIKVYWIMSQMEQWCELRHELVYFEQISAPHCAITRSSW